MEKTRKIESDPQTQGQPGLISRGMIVVMYKIILQISFIIRWLYAVNLPSEFELVK